MLVDLQYKFYVDLMELSIFMRIFKLNCWNILAEKYETNKNSGTWSGIWTSNLQNKNVLKYVVKLNKICSLRLLKETTPVN